MLTKTRLAGLAAVLIIAVASAVVPQTTQAQAQSPAPAAAAPAEPPAAPVARPGTKSTEVVDNPYGLEALWKGGDAVPRITLGILVIMSMGSWYIIIPKVSEQAKMKGAAVQREKSFWN